MFIRNFLFRRAHPNGRLPHDNSESTTIGNGSGNNGYSVGPKRVQISREPPTVYQSRNSLSTGSSDGGGRGESIPNSPPVNGHNSMKPASAQAPSGFYTVGGGAHNDFPEADLSMPMTPPEEYAPVESSIYSNQQPRYSYQFEGRSHVVGAQEVYSKDPRIQREQKLLQPKPNVSKLKFYTIASNF